MHYPVMTEKQVAARWNVSLKTLRRWRLDNEGPAWHKLFRHVRYHEADLLEFERSSALHPMALLGVIREFVPSDSDAPDGTKQDGTSGPESHYVSAKEVVEVTGLPAHLFTDRAERERKRVPHLLLVGNLRFLSDSMR